MNSSLSSAPASPEFRRRREDFPACVEKLRQLIEDKVYILQYPITKEQQGSVCAENTGAGALWRFAVLSEELTFHLQQLQRQTEQELSNICTQLSQINGRQQRLSSDLLSLQEKREQREQLKRNYCFHPSTFELCACELHVSITERLLQSERLVFQEEALSALHNLLTQDLQRYQEETQRLRAFTQKVLKQHHSRSDREETFLSRESERSMQGKSETEQQNNMLESELSSPPSPRSPIQTNMKDEKEQIRKASKRPSGLLSRGTHLYKVGSIKDLITKFSGPESPQSPSPGSPRLSYTELLWSPQTKSSPTTTSVSVQHKSSLPSIDVSPPSVKQTSQNGVKSTLIRDESTVDGSELALNKGGSTLRKTESSLSKSVSTLNGPESTLSWTVSTQKKTGWNVDKTESNLSWIGSTLSKSESNLNKPESSPNEPESSLNKPASTLSLTGSTLSKSELNLSKPESCQKKPESSQNKPESSPNKSESTLSWIGSTLSWTESTLSMSEPNLDKPDLILSKPESSQKKPESSQNKPESSPDKTESTLSWIGSTLSWTGSTLSKSESNLDKPESSQNKPEPTLSWTESTLSMPEPNLDQPDLILSWTESTQKNKSGLTLDGPESISERTDCPVDGNTEKTKSEKTKVQTESDRDSVADSGMGSESEFDTSKQLESPSEEEPTTPKPTSTSQSPKYQLFLNNEIKTNGVSGRDADGPGGGGPVGENGPRLSRWETSRIGMNHFRGSLESLASRDWDTMSDRASLLENSPRVFNSPYPTSMDYNPTLRMSEFKTGLSPATSELNLFTFNSRSTSPVSLPTPTLTAPRQRFSAYDSLIKRRTEMSSPQPGMTSHYSVRSATLGAPNRKDYIEELTKQLDACQKRNQFLEAESMEMDKERNQIRFEMRNLLVNNEDLLRTNTQLNNEMKKLREQMIEIDREKQSIAEKLREMEIEVKEAREVMVEANTQEYAFNFLQQSLQNRLKDAEECLEKETQHAQVLSEKLWHAERQLEELEVDHGTKSKKTTELNNTILRLETELAEALQKSTQAAAELNLQQKLRDDSQLRVDELEEVILEKEQELQRLQTLVTRLQGEVSGKLIDKERTLEEEIQLRERIQLQCKQAERTVDDLQMELHTTNQAKEDLAKQLKQAQEKILDLETDVEELHDSEQRWASKHKRTIEQTEQLQLKLIQEKDLNDLLETDKASMERQLRELHLEVEELQSSRVQEDVITRAEGRVKELENALRTEERNKSVLSNTVGKLERRINELSDQMEEEHRIANEQKELMAQRIRSLKRQLNDAEEEASRKETQYRHTQRELAEERETSGRLQRQLLDQHVQTKRMETLTIRQTLDNLRLDLSIDDEDEDKPAEEQTGKVTNV